MSDRSHDAGVGPVENTGCNFTRMDTISARLLSLNELELASEPIELFHQVSGWIHDISAEILFLERQGITKETIKSRLTDVRKVHAAAPWVQRLQKWPRGYQGDFETIEKMASGATSFEVDTVPKIIEKVALNSIAAQQHRNKLIHQERRIRDFASRNCNIFSIACGGSLDAISALSELSASAGDYYINDIDEEALNLSSHRLESLGSRLKVERGSIVDVFRSRQLGQFGSILAGGLFDYLPEKIAVFVVRQAIAHLEPGGEFFFTNIREGNLFRPWIEYLADWELIERSEAEIHDLLGQAGVHRDNISIQADYTGVTNLITVKSHHDVGHERVKH